MKLERPNETRWMSHIKERLVYTVMSSDRQFRSGGRSSELRS